MAAINIETTKVVIPQCYAYITPGVSYNDGWTKIGFTERDVYTRIKEQTHTAGIKVELKWHKNATYEGSNETFTDREFHAYLTKKGIERRSNSEWFKIDPEVAKFDFNDFRENKGIIESNEEPIPYKLRQEQEEAVSLTLDYFSTHEKGEFLWNAKPRFGKTLSSYDLFLNMHAPNMLIVTNRPAIANSWYQDYEKFLTTKSGYYFVSEIDSLKNEKHCYSQEQYEEMVVDMTRGEEIKGQIHFVSLQDLKGSIDFGGKFIKNEVIANTEWDLLVIDEAHEGVDTYKTDIAFDKIMRKNTLHLSGTPFKALANDKFPASAIYNWTYADEQKAKREWDNGSLEENPYETLPQLNLFTYQMSEIIKDQINQGVELDGETEEYAFDLNEFFSTKDTNNGTFVHESAVDKFLDALTTQDKFPFSTEALRDELRHTFWLLNRVDSAKALARKLEKHPIFKEYKIILAAGDGKLDDQEETKKSYDKVVEAIKYFEKTITLSVGQLTTGVTIPEWTAVLMLSNLKSPALYMQAAFRAQNPCLFRVNNTSYRKKNAYVFDFDPGRTLKIFEEFANDLSQDTSAGRGDTATRKANVRELLNFFPVYGEEEDGSMIELDAEKVLIIPRKIYAKEVVARGFMSNFLFANISNIFAAPKEVQDIINKLEPTAEANKLNIDDDKTNELYLNDEGEVEIPNEIVVGLSDELFGDKIYDQIAEDLTYELDGREDEINSRLKFDKLEDLKRTYGDPLAQTLIDTADQKFGRNLGRATKKRLENQIRKNADDIVVTEYGDWNIKNNKLDYKKQKEITQAQSMAEVTAIEEKYEHEKTQLQQELLKSIEDRIKSEDIIKKSAELIVETVVEEQKDKEKKTIEESVRDHLRGFTRTIPSFLMAYGSEDVTLKNFDKIIPSDVFQDVTSISLEEFVFLRDGGEYIEEETGEKKHFGGQLFDDVIFDDSVKEFLRKKSELSNYFDEDQHEDIFDYIPPQKTNQIFTPKKVVKEMVDLLEVENPGCFDDSSKTFIDLYMKSGLYIAEIVKRLYASDVLKREFPDNAARLNHIFANQVYGLAPTEIIYRIAVNFVLGFSDEIKIEKHNLKKCDSLVYVKDGTLEEKLEELFE